MPTLNDSSSANGDLKQYTVYALDEATYKTLQNTFPSHDILGFSKGAVMGSALVFNRLMTLLRGSLCIAHLTAHDLRSTKIEEFAEKLNMNLVNSINDSTRIEEAITENPQQTFFIPQEIIEHLDSFMHRDSDSQKVTAENNSLEPSASGNNTKIPESKDSDFFAKNYVGYSLTASGVLWSPTLSFAEATPSFLKYAPFLQIFQHLHETLSKIKESITKLAEREQTDQENCKSFFAITDAVEKIFVSEQSSSSQESPECQVRSQSLIFAHTILYNAYRILCFSFSGQHQEDSRRIRELTSQCVDLSAEKLITSFCKELRTSKEMQQNTPSEEAEKLAEAKIIQDAAYLLSKDVVFLLENALSFKSLSAKIGNEKNVESTDIVSLMSLSQGIEKVLERKKTNILALYKASGIKCCAISTLVITSQKTFALPQIATSVNRPAEATLPALELAAQDTRAFLQNKAKLPTTRPSVVTHSLSHQKEETPEASAQKVPLKRKLKTSLSTFSTRFRTSSLSTPSFVKRKQPIIKHPVKQPVASNNLADLVEAVKPDIQKMSLEQPSKDPLSTADKTLEGNFSDSLKTSTNLEPPCQQSNALDERDLKQPVASNNLADLNEAIELGVQKTSLEQPSKDSPATADKTLEGNFSGSLKTSTNLALPCQQSNALDERDLKQPVASNNLADLVEAVESDIQKTSLEQPSKDLPRNQVSRQANHSSAILSTESLSKTSASPSLGVESLSSTVTKQEVEEDGVKGMTAQLLEKTKSWFSSDSLLKMEQSIAKTILCPSGKSLDKGSCEALMGLEDPSKVQNFFLKHYLPHNVGKRGTAPQRSPIPLLGITHETLEALRKAAPSKELSNLDLLDAKFSVLYSLVHAEFEKCSKVTDADADADAFVGKLQKPLRSLRLYFFQMKYCTPEEKKKLQKSCLFMLLTALNSSVGEILKDQTSSSTENPNPLSHYEIFLRSSAPLPYFRDCLACESTFVMHQHVALSITHLNILMEHCKDLLDETLQRTATLSETYSQSLQDEMRYNHSRVEYLIQSVVHALESFVAKEKKHETTNPQGVALQSSKDIEKHKEAFSQNASHYRSPKLDSPEWRQEYREMGEKIRDILNSLQQCCNTHLQNIINKDNEVSPLPPEEALQMFSIRWRLACVFSRRMQKQTLQLSKQRLASHRVPQSTGVSIYKDADRLSLEIQKYYKQEILDCYMNALDAGIRLTENPKKRALSSKILEVLYQIFQCITNFYLFLCNKDIVAQVHHLNLCRDSIHSTDAIKQNDPLYWKSYHRFCKDFPEKIHLVDELHHSQSGSHDAAHGRSLVDALMLSSDEETNISPREELLSKEKEPPLRGDSPLPVIHHSTSLCKEGFEAPLMSSI